MRILVTFVDIIFNLLSLAIFIRIILSWIRTNQESPIFRFFDDITQPILDLAKKITPPLGMLDLSPVVALIGLELIHKILVTLITSL